VKSSRERAFVRSTVDRRFTPRLGSWRKKNVSNHGKERRNIIYFNGMRSIYTKIETIFREIFDTFIYFKHRYDHVDLYRIYSVIKFTYIHVTDEKNSQPVDRQVWLDHILSSLDQMEVFQICF
jgi:hypothetical protein